MKINDKFLIIVPLIRGGKIEIGIRIRKDSPQCYRGDHGRRIKKFVEKESKKGIYRIRAIWPSSSRVEDLF